MAVNKPDGFVSPVTTNNNSFIINPPRAVDAQMSHLTHAIGLCAGGNCRLVKVPPRVRCRYDAGNFLPNSRKRHTIARPLGRYMVCLLKIQHLIYILPPSLQWCMQYIVLLDRSITAPTGYVSKRVATLNSLGPLSSVFSRSKPCELWAPIELCGVI